MKIWRLPTLGLHDCDRQRHSSSWVEGIHCKPKPSISYQDISLKNHECQPHGNSRGNTLGITKVIRIDLVGAINVCLEFNSNTSNSRWDLIPDQPTDECCHTAV